MKKNKKSQGVRIRIRVYARKRERWEPTVSGPADPRGKGFLLEVREAYAEAYPTALGRIVFGLEHG